MGTPVLLKTQQETTRSSCIGLPINMLLYIVTVYTECISRHIVLMGPTAGLFLLLGLAASWKLVLTVRWRMTLGEITIYCFKSWALVQLIKTRSKTLFSHALQLTQAASVCGLFDTQNVKVFL